MEDNREATPRSRMVRPLLEDVYDSTIGMYLKFVAVERPIRELKNLLVGSEVLEQLDEPVVCISDTRSDIERASPTFDRDLAPRRRSCVP
jgi:hypothetical protein